MAIALAVATSLLPLTSRSATPPESSQAHYNYALELIRKGRLEEAIAPLRKAIADPDLSKEANFLLGVDYFELHKPLDAIQCLEPLRNSAHAERVLYTLEECYRRLNRAQEAQEAFHQLNTRYPDGPWIHVLMAAAYENQAQPEKAIEEYQSALKKDPAMPNIHFAIGYLHWRSGELATAATWLKEELMYTPCHSLANYYLGEIARTERDLSEAESRYRRAVTCDPNYADAHLRLGSVLSSGKNTTEALGELQIAAKLMPANSAPHYQMATLYHRLGQNAKAEAEYQLVRTLKMKAGEADEKIEIR